MGKGRVWALLVQLDLLGLPGGGAGDQPEVAPPDEDLVPGGSDWLFQREIPGEGRVVQRAGPLLRERQVLRPGAEQLVRHDELVIEEEGVLSRDVVGALDPG